MSEEKSLLQDATGMAKQEDGNKIKKYIRIALGSIGIAFFVFLFVMIFLRKYGG
jgi:hypothetical protein